MQAHVHAFWVSWLAKVQCVGVVNDYNFRVTLVSGVEAFGSPDQYKPFLEKYMSYLESRQWLSYSMVIYRGRLQSTTTGVKVSQFTKTVVVSYRVISPIKRICLLSKQRLLLGLLKYQWTVPHACGDEPIWNRPNMARGYCSPCLWGWTGYCVWGRKWWL